MERYEIGSDLWIRERIEHGLDPAEADRADDGRRHLGIAPAATLTSGIQRRAGSQDDEQNRHGGQDGYEQHRHGPVIDGIGLSPVPPWREPRRDERAS